MYVVRRRTARGRAGAESRNVALPVRDEAGEVAQLLVVVDEEEHAIALDRAADAQAELLTALVRLASA